MVKKRNDAVIAKRYIAGEKPKDIGPDYGMTAKQVSELASRKGWKQKKSEKEEKIDEIVQSEIDREESTFNLIDSLVRDVMLEYATARKTGLSGLTVQDGEGFPNKIAMQFIDAGLAGWRKRVEKKLEAPAADSDQENKKAVIEGLNESDI